MSIIKSESISNLVKALKAAKPMFTAVLKLNENPAFKRNGQVSKYADLATAIEATEAGLLANGLIISQFPVNEGDRVGALTMLMHESGEFIGEAFTLPLGQQNAPTGVAAVTYARRTGYLAVLSIAAEDDDGQTVSRDFDQRSISAEAYSHPASTTEMPDFQDAKRGTEKPKAATRPTPAPAATGGDTTLQATTKPSGTPSATSAAVPAAVPSTPVQEPVGAAVSNSLEQGDAYEGPDVEALPTEAEMQVYRDKFVKLSNDLAGQGKLKASKGLKTNTKLQVFILSVTKAAAMKELTTKQWDNFFARVKAAVENPEVGLLGLTALVNKANGIDPKEK